MQNVLSVILPFFALVLTGYGAGRWRGLDAAGITGGLALFTAAALVGRFVCFAAPSPRPDCSGWRRATATSATWSPRLSYLMARGGIVQ